MSFVAFDHTPRTRVIFGANCVDRLGELVRELGVHRVLLVTDPGIVAAGHVKRARKSLRKAGVHAIVFSDVRENPTTLDVDRCVIAALDSTIGAIVALGGGSSMDTAKGCNFLLSNGGRMQDYWGDYRMARPMLPLIAVPTTAGTGSECQRFALIADEETHQKMACGDPAAAPRIALLDPTLTLSQPRNVTACTGIDAIAHAVETAATTRRTALSEVWSREAFRLCIGNFARVLTRPDDLDARSAMLLGSSFAGMAIEASMLGAAHSAANPLTARFGVVHGHAVGLMLPHVVRFNAEEPSANAAYLDLMHAANIDHELHVDALVEALKDCLVSAGLPTRLSDLGIVPDDLPDLAFEAAKQWTAQFNPRPVCEADFYALYQAAT